MKNPARKARRGVSFNFILARPSTITSARILTRTPLATGAFAVSRYNPARMQNAAHASQRKMTMNNFRTNILLFLPLLFAGAAPAALAQNFPDKPVTMIAPFPAGGSVDLVAR